MTSYSDDMDFQSSPVGQGQTQYQFMVNTPIPQFNQGPQPRQPADGGGQTAAGGQTGQSQNGQGGQTGQTQQQSQGDSSGQTQSQSAGQANQQSQNNGNNGSQGNGNSQNQSQQTGAVPPER